MIRKLSSKFFVCALLISITFQACASLMSRQQQVEYIENKLQLSVISTPMPPVISKKIKRLSIIYITPTEEYPMTTSLVDLTINYLKKQQADLTVVEREAVDAVQKEYAYQLTGNISPATAAQLGKQLGADALLLIYFKPITTDDFKLFQWNGGIMLGTMDLRLIHVEEGAVLFRTNTSAVAVYPKPPAGQYWLPKTINTWHDILIAMAAAFELAGLGAALDENPLGIVPDMDLGIQQHLKKLQLGVTLFGLLEGSPAQKSGLQRFDRIVRVDGRSITTWMDKIQLPANVIVDRDGTELDFKITK